MCSYGKNYIGGSKSTGTELNWLTGCHSTRRLYRRGALWSRPNSFRSCGKAGALSQPTWKNPGCNARGLPTSSESLNIYHCFLDFPESHFGYGVQIKRICHCLVPGSIPGGLGVPENITVTFLNPTSVKVSWATAVDNVDKYDVTYKPTDARWVL